MPRAAVRGITMVEMLVVVVICTILIGMAAPSFLTTFARLRMEGMVNELSVDLQYARSASIRWQAPVALVTSDDGTFYTIRRDALVLKMVSLPARTTVTTGVTVTFDPLRGLANAAQMDVANTQITPRLRVNTNAMGRVQVCSPSGDFSGYAAC